MNIVLICGPWGSGTTLIAQILDRLGIVGLPPYFMTNDPGTPNSYESIAFRETILQYVSEPTLSLITGRPGDVQSGLRRLLQLIEQQESGTDYAGFAKPIFLKYPACAPLIPQICEVFDTKLIYVWRSLEDIEQTRIRRNWFPYLGGQTAPLIYDQMSAALKQHPNPTMNIDFKEVLLSPKKAVRDIAQFVGLEPTREESRRAVGVVRH